MVHCSPILSPWSSSSIWNYIMSGFSWLPDGLRRDHSYRKNKQPSSRFGSPIDSNVNFFFFLSSMLQVWSTVNLEIKFQIRLSNGILMDCWPISCGMAACKSGWNTINFLGSVLKSFLDKKETRCANLSLQMEKLRQNYNKSRWVFQQPDHRCCMWVNTT